MKSYNEVSERLFKFAADVMKRGLRGDAYNAALAAMYAECGWTKELFDEVLNAEFCGSVFAARERVYDLYGE